MAKPVPSTGQINWGTPLNAHLSQLNEPSTGGINFAPEPPTGLGAGDEGYTYVNTTFREIQRWNGSEFEVLMGGVATGRERLEQTRTYYINVDTGDDNNDGLTSGSAFKTIQKASNLIRNKIDSNGFSVIISLAESVNPYDGASFDDVRNVILQGNNANPAAVRIQANNTLGTVNAAVRVANEALVIIKGVSFAPSPVQIDNAQAVSLSFNARCLLSRVNFEDITTNANLGIHISSLYGGFVDFQDDYSVSGSAVYHIFLSGQSQARFYKFNATINVTVSNNPNFGGAFIDCNSQSSCSVEPTTFTGSATGKRYSLRVQSSIITNGQGQDLFPGNVAGTADASSVYVA